MAANPPAFLDFAGVEMLLIGGREGHQGLKRSLGDEDAKGELRLDHGQIVLF